MPERIFGIHKLKQIVASCCCKQYMEEMKAGSTDLLVQLTPLSPTAYKHKYI